MSVITLRMVFRLDIIFPWKDCQQIAVVVYHSTLNMCFRVRRVDLPSPTRHNEIRDLTAGVLDEICSNVNVCRTKFNTTYWKTIPEIVDNNNR